MAKVKDEKTDAELLHGRREKLRQNFDKLGLQSFHDSHVLEYALGFCVPRVDTHPTAHRLLETFGSLANVVDAHPSKLEKVPGMGKNSAYLIAFLRQFVTYYMGSKTKQDRISTSADAIEHLREFMKTLGVEEFVLMALNKNGKVLLEKKVEGTLNRVNIDLRDVMDMVLRVKASAVVLAHNHPEDTPDPSDSDVLFTRAMVNLLTPLGIQLVDHLIFSRTDDVYSFRESKFLELFINEHKEFARNRNFAYT
ncbi:MAG: hypothetical protein FWE31_00615 [Firmicutes bacterium]|nr:hypothetical protein [Bacillota bacterium]